jgi:hypothetical protein
MPMREVELMRMRSAPAVLSLAGAALLLAGCAAQTNDVDRDDTGVVTEAQSGVDVFDLALGDCFNAEEGTGEVTKVQVVPCTDLHRYEIFHEYTLPEGELPTDLEEQALAGCNAQFEPFVGLANEVSKYEISYFAPTTASWSLGDRLVSCLVFDPSGTDVQGSLKNIGQ